MTLSRFVAPSVSLTSEASLLQFICPTRSPDGYQGFADSRPAAAMFHAAIQRSKCRGKMRLGLSWMLDYKRSFWDAWNSTADSMRTDEVTTTTC